MTNKLLIAGTFVLGAAAGAVTGYFVSRKRAQLYYAEMAAKDIHEVKEHYRLLRKENFESPKVEEEPVVNDPSKVKVVDSDDLTELQTILSNNGYLIDAEQAASMFNKPVSEVAEFFEKMGSLEVEEEIVETSVTSVFNIDEEEYLQDEDLEVRDPEYREAVRNRTFEEPYVIHINEYMTDTDEYEKLVLNYYFGDDTLTVDNDDVLSDPEALLGDGFREQFGKFSGDADTLYIRNEVRSAEYEIHYIEDGYFDTQMGLTSTQEKGDD